MYLRFWHDDCSRRSTAAATAAAASARDRSRGGDFAALDRHGRRAAGRTVPTRHGAARGGQRRGRGRRVPAGGGRR
eukprot:1630909-Prymnesium_polylepis.1